MSITKAESTTKVTKLTFKAASGHAEAIRHHDGFALAHKLALGIEILNLKAAYGVDNGKSTHIPGPDGVELSWPAKVTLETGYSYSTIQRWMGMATALADQKKALGTLLKAGDPTRVLEWLKEKTEGMTDGDLKQELGLIIRRETPEQPDNQGEEASNLGGDTGGKKSTTERRLAEDVADELAEITDRLHKLVTAGSHHRVPADALAIQVDALEVAAKQLREDLSKRKKGGK